MDEGGQEYGVGPGRRGRDVLLVLAVAALCLAPFTWQRDLFDADEGRYAAVARDMVRSGDWVVPHLDGMPFMDKPPLVYWVQAAGIEAFGASAFVARLPTLIAGCLWVLFVFLFARDWSGSRRDALWAALLAATSAAGMIGSRVGPQMDMPLAACVAGALYAAWRGLLRPGVISSLGLGLAVGLGLLTKGPLVVAAPFLVAVAWLLAGVKVRRVLRVVFSPWAWIMALLVAAPWYVHVECAKPGWIHHFITYEHFGRFGEGDHRDFHPFWFYIPIALIYLAPWTPIAWVRGGHEGARRVLTLVTGSPWSLRPWRPALPMQHPLGRGGSAVTSGRLAWGWFLILFLLYSLSTRKLLNYLLPAALPLFVLAGSRFSWLLDRHRRLPFVLPVLLGVAAVVGGALVQTGTWFPLATGGVPDAAEASRWTGLGPWMIAAGLVLLVATLAASWIREKPRARGLLLVLGALLFWWGLDTGLARVSELGSARRIAAALAKHEAEGRIPVALKRYPQGIRFYEDVDVWIAGGTPDRWRQREIVNPYARQAWASRRGLLTDEEFERLWRSDLDVVLVCRKGEIELLGAHVLEGPFAGAGRTDLYLVGNHPPGNE